MMAGMELPRPKDINDVTLVTHLNCMDGSGCAIAFRSAGGEKVEFVAAGRLEKFVEKRLPDIPGFVIIADLGTASQECLDALERRGDLVLIDHHRTSRHASGRAWAVIDEEACGTELLRRYLIWMDLDQNWSRGVLKDLASMIDSHDRWTHADPRGDELSLLSAFMGQGRFIEEFGVKPGRGIGENFFRSDERRLVSLLRERRDQALAEAVRRTKVYDTPSGKRMAALITASPDISFVLQGVLSAFPEADFIVGLNLEKGQASLRSRGDFDVSEFCREFGGGGHLAAAGHNLPGWILDELVSEIY